MAKTVDKMDAAMIERWLERVREAYQEGWEDHDNRMDLAVDTCWEGSGSSSYERAYERVKAMQTADPQPLPKSVSAESKEAWVNSSTLNLNTGGGYFYCCLCTHIIAHNETYYFNSHKPARRAHKACVDKLPSQEPSQEQA